jgi:hypothetical protein
VKPAPRYHRWPAVLVLVGALLLVGVATCEVLGWPFLAGPIQGWLSSSLHRRVNLSIDGHTPASVVVHLLGRVRIEAPQIEIGAPPWSEAPRMLVARDAVVSLHYADLWRAHRGGALRIHMLEAAELDADIERLADGRASWHFGAAPPATNRAAHTLQFPLFDRLKLQAGTLRLRDEVSGLRLTLQSVPTDAAPAESAPLALRGRGSWRGQALDLLLRSSGPMPWLDRSGADERMPLTVEAMLGETRVVLEGSAVDALGLNGLIARVQAAGPSLAPLAEACGIPLSPQGAFEATGQLRTAASSWTIDLDRLQLGRSELRGQFTLDRGPARPRLTGRVAGPRLALGDWRGPWPPGASPRTVADLALPSLRDLDVDLVLDLDALDLGAGAAPQPWRGHWALTGGRLVSTPAANSAR